jgi:hypothetical protein
MPTGNMAQSGPTRRAPVVFEELTPENPTDVRISPRVGFNPNDPEAVADLDIDPRLVRSNLGITSLSSQSFRDMTVEELECAAGTPGDADFALTSREGNRLVTDSIELHQRTGCVTTNMVDRSENVDLPLLWCPAPNQVDSLRTCELPFTTPRLNNKFVAVYDPTSDEAFMLSWTVPDAEFDIARVECVTGAPTTKSFSLYYRDAEGELQRLRFHSSFDSTNSESIERTIFFGPGNTAHRSRWDALGTLRTPGMVHLLPSCPSVVYKGFREVQTHADKAMESIVCASGGPESDNFSINMRGERNAATTMDLVNPRINEETNCITFEGPGSDSIWCPGTQPSDQTIPSCDNEELQPEDTGGEPISELLRSMMAIPDPVTGGAYKLVGGTVNGIGEIQCAVGTPGTSVFMLMGSEDHLVFQMAETVGSDVQEIIRLGPDNVEYRWQRISEPAKGPYMVPLCESVVVPGLNDVNYRVLGTLFGQDDICILQGASPTDSTYVMQRTVNGSPVQFTAEGSAANAAKTGCIKRTFSSAMGSFSSWFCPTSDSPTASFCTVRTTPNPDSSSSSEGSAASDGSGEDDGMSTETIAGIAVGSVAGLLLIGVIVYFSCCKGGDGTDSSSGTDQPEN